MHSVTAISVIPDNLNSWNKKDLIKKSEFCAKLLFVAHPKPNPVSCGCSDEQQKTICH